MTQFYNGQRDLSREELGGREEIEGNTKNFQNKKIAIFFDVDGTLVSIPTHLLLAFYLYSNKKIKFTLLCQIFIWFLLYKLGLISSGVSLLKKACQLLKGMKTSDFKEILYDCYLKKIKKRIFPQAIMKIKEHQSQNHEVVLISSHVIEPIVEIISKEIGAPLWIATKLEVENQIYTGNVLEVIYGESKLKKLLELKKERNWDLKKSYFYTDHHSDLPLLKIIGNPVIVNPTFKLERIAKRNNWPILKWKIYNKL